MNTKSTDTIITLAAVVIALGNVPLSIMVATKIWAWHFVPLGAPEANWAAIWGVLLFGWWVRGPDITNRLREGTLKGDWWRSAIFGHTCTVLFLWFVAHVLRSYAVVGAM